MCFFQQKPQIQHLVSRGLPKVSSNNSHLSKLYKAAKKYPQYRAVDFAKLSNFPNLDSLNSENINLALFAFGSCKHLLALCDGTLPLNSANELINRIQHLANVFELVCLSSSVSDFQGQSWSIGKNYNSRVLHDLEFGLKSWETLGKAIDSTCWQFARELITQPQQNFEEDFITQPQQDFSAKGPRVCTSWNTFKKDGCQFEFLNPGANCKYLHICSKCKTNGPNGTPHKSWQCFEEDLNSHISEI